MYQALYRKYRPKSFDEVVEQEHITTTLSNQILKGQINHAYLFTGSRGTGKTSIAKIFARAVNCEKFDGKRYCDNCETCKALDNPSNLDILEIDAASNNKVDEIRDLRENIKFLPVNAKYKVYIIDEVHMLTDSAFNALLKTLEEPPKHVIFILATTEVQKIPQTILSRCIRFDFALVSVDSLCKHLKYIFEKENISYDEEGVKAIAVAGEGSVRDTLSIADCIVAFSGGNVTLENVRAVLGTNSKETILGVIKAIAHKDIGTGLEIIDKVTKSGKNISVFAKDITVALRDLLIIKTCKEPNKLLNFSQDVFDSYSEIANLIEQNLLLDSMKIFSVIEAELKFAISPRTLVETAFITAISGDVKKN